MASGNKRKKGWWIFPLLGVAFIYTAFTVYSQSGDIYALRLGMNEIQSRIDKENATHDQLLEQKDEITSDESIEKIAREKLGMVKDGERVFVDTNK